MLFFADYGHGICCSDKRFEIPFKGSFTTGYGHLHTWVESEIEATAELNIIVTLNAVFPALKSNTLLLSDASRLKGISTVNRKIMEEGLSSDLSIVCAEKSEIKCHKSFLIGNSLFFIVNSNFG